jgi:transcriptional regulator with XRE-family HTH domain
MFDLKQLIKDLNLNQNQFSDKIGKSQTAISKIITGNLDFPDSWKEIITDKFGIYDFSKYEIEEETSMAMEPEAATYGYGISIPGLMKVIGEQAEAIRELTATQARLVDLLSKKY